MGLARSRVGLLTSISLLAVVFLVDVLESEN
jgi:hypothetical protein